MSSRHHLTYVRGKSAGITIALKSSPMASCMRSAPVWGSSCVTIVESRRFRPIFAASFEDMSMTSPTWRALGQVVLVYFAVGGAAVTAQDIQPGRATFAEMIAFARLASVPCQRLAPDADSFHALALRRLIKPPSPRKRLLLKKRTSSGFEFVSGLAAGASTMPAKWSRRVFSCRFYEGKISVPVTLTSCAFRKSYPDVMAPRLS
jgi:hypothetical protein